MMELSKRALLWFYRNAKISGLLSVYIVFSSQIYVENASWRGKWPTVPCRMLYTLTSLGLAFLKRKLTGPSRYLLVVVMLQYSDWTCPWTKRAVRWFSDAQEEQPWPNFLATSRTLLGLAITTIPNLPCTLPCRRSFNSAKILWCSNCKRLPRSWQGKLIVFWKIIATMLSRWIISVL